MSRDLSFLSTKQLVYSCGIPPFAIYDGMLETVYMLHNSVAFSSLYTPGIYTVLGEILRALQGKKLLVDDLLGMMPSDFTNVVSSRKVIERLMSLNRITWKCPHVEAPDLSLGDHDVVANVSPLAFMHANRLQQLNLQVVNASKKTFIFPAGQTRKARNVAYFVGAFLKRQAHMLAIPANLVDNCFVIVPGRDVDVSRLPWGMYMTKIPRVDGGRYDIKNERALYEYLYG